MLKGKDNLYVEYTDRPSRFMVDLCLEEKRKQEKLTQEKLKKDKKLRIKTKARLVLNRVLFFIKMIFFYFDKFFDSIRLFIIFVVRKIATIFVSRKKIHNDHKEIENNTEKYKRIVTFSIFISIINVFISFTRKFKKIIFNFWKRKKIDNNVQKEEPAENNFFGLKSLKSPIILGVMMFLLISPVKMYTFAKSLLEMKGRVLGISELAIDDISNAKDSASELDFSKASESFDSARNNFEQARVEIEQISVLLSTIGKIIPNKDVKFASYAEKILRAGVISANLGNHLSVALESISAEDRSVKSIIESFHNFGKLSIEEAGELAKIINSINAEYLPVEYRTQFEMLKDKSYVLEDSLGEFVDILDKAKIFLGFEYDKRYLLVFQNNTELRASGGFIGSYAVVDFRDGEIRKIDAPGGGSYDTEGGLRERIIAPKPLHLVNPLWHFWDANWWPDWKKSAEKLTWFYEKSGGTTVDGVISFTPTMFESILKVIGPIDMTEKYGVVIDAENFWVTVQSFAEQKQDITNTPKKIIGDMFDKILITLPERLNKDVLFELSLKVERAFQEKQALFYFSNDELQSKAEQLGWAGRMRNTAWDYLMVVNTNIAGGKSDRKIQEEITHAVSVEEDGSITNIVKIKRVHTGIKREDFSGVRNVNWMRVYVPIGSKLIEARGFDQPDISYFEDPEDWWEADPDVLEEETDAMLDIESQTKIYNESGKTVFANWSMVDPGETVTIYIKYKLPFKLILDSSDIQETSFSDVFKTTDNELIPYALLVQKQPGSLGSKFNSILKLPENYKNKWQFPAEQNISEGGWNKDDILDTDKYWAVLLEKED